MRKLTLTGLIIFFILANLAILIIDYMLTHNTKEKIEITPNYDMEETTETEVVETQNTIDEIIENTTVVEESTQENKTINTIKKETAKEPIKNTSNITKNTSKYNEDAFVDGHLKNYPLFGTKYATLKVNKININSKIYFGLTDDILTKGIAHDTGSYLPGEGGSIIICGHNFMNNFNKLRKFK